MGVLAFPALVLGGVPLRAHTLAAQTSSPSPADSLDLLEQAKDVQARYERYREQRTLPDLAALTNRCDDVVGRYCFRFPDHIGVDEWRAPDQPVELELARTRVLRDLGDIAGKIPGDLWVLGQRVYYLTGMGAWGNAVGLAQRCGGRSHWWCTALAAYVDHERGRWTVAEEGFARALEQMPPDTAARWTAPEHLLENSAWNSYERAADKKALQERLWMLSDPLYLVEGNDRKTEQYARQVLVRIRAQAVNGTGLDWEDDLEEITLRWGAAESWSRERDVQTGDTLVDSRRMVSHRRGQEFLPSAEVLEDPSEVGAGAWALGDRVRLELREGGSPVDQLPAGGLLEALTQTSQLLDGNIDLVGMIRDGTMRSGPRTGYTAPYAPTLDVLETQIARFRRGDSLLVAGAFAPRAEQEKGPAAAPRMPDGRDFRAERNESRSDLQRRTNPFGVVRETPVAFLPDVSEQNVESGLFLIDSESGERHQVRGEGPEGAFQLQAPNGHYVVGLEVFSPLEKQAWRERHGLWQDPIVPGLAAISDLLILQGGGEVPTSLDEALPTALPALRIEEGEAFKVAWEVYGLRVGETASVRIGVTLGRTGIIGRLGEFLRLLGPDEPVVMTYEDAGPDVLGTVFRAVELNLSDLEPAEYTLTVEIDLAGREPMTVDRAILVVPSSTEDQR